MPFKSNSHFDSLFAMAALLNDTELRALADKCQQLIANREQIKRNQLRQELMENLQKAIDDILSNGFDLTISNVKRSYLEGHQDVWFQHDDTCHIEIE